MIGRLFALGAVIGLNNLAASLALGAIGARHHFRIVLVFGIFEFTVPLAGLLIGQRASGAIGDWTEWLGPGLLAGLGIVALWSASRQKKDDEKLARALSGWKGLVLLATGLSVDNLVVGFSLGLSESQPLLVAATIAIFSMSFAAIGLRLGSASRRHWETAAEVAAGIALLGLAGAIVAGWL